MRIALIGGYFPAGKAQPVAGLQAFGGDDPAGEDREPGFQIVAGGQRQIEPQFFCGATGKLFDQQRAAVDVAGYGLPGYMAR